MCKGVFEMKGFDIVKEGAKGKGLQFLKDKGEYPPSLNVLKSIDIALTELLIKLKETHRLKE